VKHVREWLRRYLPAEAVGIVGALAGALLVMRATGAPVAAAFAGSVGETVGYYATIGWRDVVRHHRPLEGTPHRRFARAVGLTARDLAVEFGPAEALDSILLRPLLMYVGPVVTGHFLAGTLFGKLTADVAFYAFAITGYEVRKRIFGRPSTERASDHVA
jgi:hypothetical protein